MLPQHSTAGVHLTFACFRESEEAEFHVFGDRDLPESNPATAVKPSELTLEKWSDGQLQARISQPDSADLTWKMEDRFAHKPALRAVAEWLEKVCIV